MKIKLVNKSILAAALAVSLVGCNNADAPANEPQPETQTEEAADQITESLDETEAEESTQEAETDAEKPEETKETEETEKPKEEGNEESKPASTAEAAEGEDDLVLEEGDGLYFSSLVASKNGERDPEFDSPFLYDLKIEDDILTLDGSIDYRENPDDRENSQPYENGSYNFKLSPDVVFQGVGGTAEPKYYTTEEFIEFYNEVKDSGLALFLDVENGLVTTVSVSS